MQSTRLVRSYRIGWLATTLALAGALVAGSWVNYRGARAAVATLNRGQADLLEAAMREAFQPWSAGVDSTALNAFMTAHPEFGVRYIALFDPEGEVAVSAGSPAAPPVLPALDARFGPGSPLVEAGGRVRVYFPRLLERRPGPRGREGAPEHRDAPDATVRRRGPPLALNLVEFEPVIASGLVARATQSLVLACVGASILTLAALLFWRTSERYAQARLRLEEQRRLTVLGEMSAVLAHEIRNPLASLKGTAQLLAERLPAESKERARADRVIREAVRIEALTSDLLAFARSGPIETTPADPVEVARSSMADVSEDGFELDADAAPGRWPLDAARVRQALVNVLDNARHASPEGRPPRVRVAEEHDRLVYEVRDFGPGLPAGSEERLFDPFFTTRTNGTGLGLAVARRVAEMHGGDIQARNHPEGGAVFRIVLPHTRS